MLWTKPEDARRPTACIRMHSCSMGSRLAVLCSREHALNQGACWNMSCQISAAGLTQALCG